MNQDEQNLNLLGIMHLVLGPLTMLFSSVFLIHVVMGIMMLRGSFPDAGEQGPPAVVGWLFVVAGSVAVLLGWTLGAVTIVAGSRLRKHVGKTFCLVVAAIECINMPLGTILGVFTIITLQKESVSNLFNQSGSPLSSPDKYQ